MELLELHNITKRYPGVIALNDVSISFRKGEVHALVGENGAGKSTFIKTISGAVQPNEGEIIFDGITYDHLTPQKSLELGISVVYQEMIQFEAMSVADNLFMWLYTIPLACASAFVFHFPPVVTFIALKSDQILKCIPNGIRCNRYKWVRDLTR